MICPKCGHESINGSKFCVKCGFNFQEQPSTITIDPQPVEIQPMNNGGVNPSMPNETVNVSNNMNPGVVNSMPSQEPVQPAAAALASNTKVSFMAYFYMIIAVILKPFTAFKEESEKLKDFKNSAIIAGIVTVIFTLISVVKMIWSIVRVTDLDENFKTVKVWAWENLKNVNFFQVIGKYLLIYVGIMLAIACVYYVAGLIAKKQPNFAKFLGISALGVVPAYLTITVLSPLFGMMSYEVGMIVAVVGIIYSFTIIYEGINNELQLEGNVKFYVNAACLAILIIVGGYTAYKLVLGSAINTITGIGNNLGGELDDLYDMFN